jgi:signal transduction histidine kinase
VRVRTGTGRDGSTTLTVRNTGPVIPPADIAGLFEPFRRFGADRSAGPPGAGLGLSIVRSIIRVHHGEVTARPRDGGGLVVTATLPPTHEAG